MIKLYNFDELRPEEILNRDIRAEKNVEDVVDGIIANKASYQFKHAEMDPMLEKLRAELQNKEEAK